MTRKAKVKRAASKGQDEKVPAAIAAQMSVCAWRRDVDHKSTEIKHLIRRVPGSNVVNTVAT